MAIKCSRENIVMARIRAELSDDDALRAKYKISWEKTDPDKRHGSTHAWHGDGTYIGQFRTHENALNAGAAVTRLATIWFVWTDASQDDTPTAEIPKPEAK